VKKKQFEEEIVVVVEVVSHVIVLCVFVTRIVSRLDLKRGGNAECTCVERRNYFCSFLCVCVF
jgi:hypothetical protein